jgi:hypothetical protein
MFFDREGLATREWRITRIWGEAQTRPPHVYKVNWDATIHKTTWRVGLGAIVRNHQGYLNNLENFEPVAAEALIWEPYMLQSFEEI